MKGRKDVSKLTPKKVLVNRKGKTYETTVYVGQSDNQKANNKKVTETKLKNVLHDKLVNANPKGVKLSKQVSRKRTMAIGKGLPTSQLILEAHRCGILTEKEKNHDVTRMRVLMKIRQQLEEGGTFTYHTKHIDYFNQIQETHKSDMDRKALDKREDTNTVITFMSGMRRVKKSELKNVSKLEKSLLDFMEAENIHLVIDKRKKDSVEKENMSLMTSQDNGALIYMTRDFLDKKGNSRLVTLAHELGHYCDFKFNAEYDSDVFCKGDEMAQEMIAWEYGADLLHELGFHDFDLLSVEKHDALYTYAYNDGVYLEDCIENTDDMLNDRVDLLHELTEKRKKQRKEQDDDYDDDDEGVTFEINDDYYEDEDYDDDLIFDIDDD